MMFMIENFRKFLIIIFQDFFIKIVLLKSHIRNLNNQINSITQNPPLFSPPTRLPIHRLNPDRIHNHDIFPVMMTLSLFIVISNCINAIKMISQLNKLGRFSLNGERHQFSDQNFSKKNPKKY
jgi:hypothetical protein